MFYPCKLVFAIIPLIIGLLAVAFITYSLLNSSSEPVVKANDGVFQGIHASDGEYIMYLGIPYAHVNRSNVFGPAIPQNKLDKLYIADNDTVICPQYNDFDKTVIGSLDCLRLNIYTPKFSKTKRRHPVLVFIHGGDYKSGSSQSSFYGPKFLIKHGIIVITLNYRLGPYGFICSDDAQIGNQGLKDQLLALEWIRRNIVHFGGDPRKVTIAGEQSGGESVNLHLLYSKKVLFHKAIIDSGIFAKNREEGESAVIDLAEDFDFEGDNETDALSYLNEQSIKSVIATSVKLKLDFSPCIEKEHDNAYITRNITFQNFKRIPVLISHSDKEMMREYSLLDLERKEYRDLLYDELSKRFDLLDDELRKMENHVRHFYMKDERVGERTKPSVIDFLSDLHCNYPTKRMIEMYFKNDPYAVYYCVFSYDGDRNLAKKIHNITMSGATRGDSLGYLFDISEEEKINDDNERIIEYMTTLWTNFVKYGNPTPEKTTLIPVKWAPVARGKLNYLEISSTLTNKLTPFRNRTSFWDMMYKIYGNQERITKNVEPWRGDMGEFVTGNI